LPEQEEIKSEQKLEIEKPEPLQAFASVNEIQNAYFNLNYPSGLSSLANYVIPRDYLGQLKEAKRLRNIDLVDRLIKIRKDYTLPIKGIKCNKKGQQTFYDKNVLPLVQRFAKQWIVEKYSVGECFAHYGFKNEKVPMYLRLEDPENITPIEFLGFEAYEIRLGAGIKEQIKKLQEQKAIERLPAYLRKAINSEGYVADKVTLDKDNMYRTSDGRQDYEVRTMPPILKIAKQLMLRNFLLDLDYVNAFASQKTSIIHVKCGDKDNQKMWDATKIKEMHDLIVNRPPGQAFITTRYDVSINSVKIDLNDMFDAKKFQECNSDILNFMGIPIAFVPTQSGDSNNSVVIVSLKPLEQSIKTDREIFEEFLQVYFEQVNERNGFSEMPIIEYKHINVRGDAELIKELQFLKDSGVLSFEKICLEFDYDYDEVMKEKENDWNKRDIQAPTFENSQGLEPVLTPTVNQKIKIANETKQQDNSQNTNTDLKLPKNNQTKNK
jgi:hypothetical protein